MYDLLLQNITRHIALEPEDTSVALLKNEDLELLYRKVPKFERFFRIMLQNAFIAQQKRILQNIGSTGEDRYLAFREKYPQLEQRLPQHQIAAYQRLDKM